MLFTPSINLCYDVTRRQADGQPEQAVEGRHAADDPSRGEPRVRVEGVRNHRRRHRRDTQAGRAESLFLYLRTMLKFINVGNRFYKESVENFFLLEIVNFVLIKLTG